MEKHLSTPFHVERDPRQLERTHVHVHELSFQWDCVLPCSETTGCISYTTERYSGSRVWSSYTRTGGRFEAAIRRTAEVLKTERIKLPADANIKEEEEKEEERQSREDDKMFPPICLTRLNRGRSGCGAARTPTHQSHHPYASLRELQPTRA